MLTTFAIDEITNEQTHWSFEILTRFSVDILIVYSYEIFIKGTTPHKFGPPPNISFIIQCMWTDRTKTSVKHKWNIPPHYRRWIIFRTKRLVNFGKVSKSAELTNLHSAFPRSHNNLHVVCLNYSRDYECGRRLDHSYVKISLSSEIKYILFGIMREIMCLYSGFSLEIKLT